MSNNIDAVSEGIRRVITVKMKRSKFTFVDLFAVWDSYVGGE